MAAPRTRDLAEYSDSVVDSHPDLADFYESLRDFELSISQLTGT